MSEVLTINESCETSLALNEAQAEALRALGRELRGQSSFHWSDAVEDGAEAEVEGAETPERTIIRCSHGENGNYKVRVANAVGVVALPDVTLHVLPKIPISHFVHLARKAYSSPRIGQDLIGVDTLDVFFEVVAQWAVTEIEHLIRYGLLSDYRTMTEDLVLVRGRADVRQTANNFLRGRLEARCTFDELDLDHPLNRVLRAATRVIASSKAITNQDLKKRASRLDRAMDGVGEFKRSDLRTTLDRRTHRYADAFDLSCRILGLLGTNILSGQRTGRTFLIPTPGLIEEAVRKLLQNALDPLPVTNAGRRVPGDVYFSVNPDLVIANGTITGDVKYKTASTKWNRNDVQQAAMFAAGYQATAAFIATFSCESAVTDISMTLGALEIRRFNWKAQLDVDPVDAEYDFLHRIKSYVLSHMSDCEAASSIGPAQFEFDVSAVQ